MKHTTAAWLIMTCLIWSPARAAADVSVTPLTPGSNVFAGREVGWRFAVQAREEFRGRVAWRFSVGNRTLARREQPVVAGFGRVGEVDIRLELPEINDGVVLSATLTVILLGSDNREHARHEHTVFIFPEDPFPVRRTWLQKLDIRLFDPEGNTAAMLTEARVPFKPIVNIDAFDALESGLLLIGEGVSLRDYRGLWTAVTRTAARGVPVLCLALSGGDFALPTGHPDAGPRPDSIAFRRHDIITELDKRLDPETWPPDGRSVASSLALTGGRGSVDLTVQTDRNGWPWLELGYVTPSRSASPTRLIVCGFAIMEKWNETPAARYLFAELLNYVVPVAKSL